MDTPDFQALARDAGDEGGAQEALAARLAALQARVARGCAYALARPGRTRLLQTGTLSERVGAPRGPPALAPREVLLFNDALVALTPGKAGWTLAWEVPLGDASAFDRLSLGDALAWDVRGGGGGALAATLEAPDPTTKLSWFSTLAAALADAAPPERRFDLHRSVVRGTLWSAALEGDEPAARELVRYTLTGRQRGVGGGGLPPQPVTDIDAVDDAGCTALHLATTRGDCGLMTLLLEAGAAPDTVNDELDSPLHVACSGGHVEGVALLAANGAPVGMRNLLEQTPLQVALCSPRMAADPPALRAAVELLLVHGADAAARDSDQLTPLHRVALLHGGGGGGSGGGGGGGDRPGGEALAALVAALVRAGCDPAARAPLRRSDDDGDDGEGGAGRADSEESYTSLHLACGTPVAGYYSPLSDDDDDDDEDDADGGGEGGAAVAASTQPPPPPPEGSREEAAGGQPATGRWRRVAVEVIVALAEHGCPVNSRTSGRGETPLHLLLRGAAAAAARGRSAAQRRAECLSAVQRLVALGARWGVPDAAGVTAGSLAERLLLLPGLSGGSGGLEALSQRFTALEAPADALAVGDKVARALPRPAPRAGAEVAAPTPASAPAAPAAAGGGKQSAALGGLGRLFGAAFSRGKAGVAKLEGGSGGGLAGGGGDARVAELCQLCAARFSLLATRRRQCRRCRATVCAACASKSFPLAAALLAPPLGDVDSDDDDAPPPGAPPRPGQQVATKLAAGLSALQLALAPPTGGGGGGGGGPSNDAGAALLRLSSARRVCDPCFLQLRAATVHALAEARAFEIERSAAMRKAVNFADFAGSSSSSSSAGGGGAGAPTATTPAAPPHSGRSTARSQHAKVAQAGSLQGTLAETQQQLAQRGERLSRLQDRASDMSAQAGEFASLAAQLKAQSRRGFW